MSRDASIVLTFPDGEDYVFRLAWGELIKIQEASKVGPFVLYLRLHNIDWMVEDISTVLRYGLVGGGMGEVQAKKLVREYVEKRPPLESLPLAQTVMKIGVMGPPDEETLPIKKAEAPIDSTNFQTVESGSAPSTVQVQ